MKKFYLYLFVALSLSFAHAEKKIDLKVTLEGNIDKVSHLIGDNPTIYLFFGTNHDLTRTQSTIHNYKNVVYLYNAVFGETIKIIERNDKGFEDHELVGVSFEIPGTKKWVTGKIEYYFNCTRRGELKLKLLSTATKNSTIKDFNQNTIISGTFTPNQ